MGKGDKEREGGEIMNRAIESRSTIDGSSPSAYVYLVGC